MKKPFKDYVAVDMLPKTGDATNFVVSFPYQIEGTIRTERKQLPVVYTDTQAAIDAKNGITDGLAQQKEQAIATLERGIAQELRMSAIGFTTRQIRGWRSGVAMAAGLNPESLLQAAAHPLSGSPVFLRCPGVPARTFLSRSLRKRHRTPESTCELRA